MVIETEYTILDILYDKFVRKIYDELSEKDIDFSMNTAWDFVDSFEIESNGQIKINLNETPQEDKEIKIKMSINLQD